MYNKRYGSKYFEKKARNYINKKIENIENGPCPDYPERINRDGVKERKIVITDNLSEWVVLGVDKTIDI